MALMTTLCVGITMFVVSLAAPAHAAVADATPGAAETVTFTLQPTDDVGSLSGGSAEAVLPHVNCFFFMDAPAKRTDLGTALYVGSTATTHCVYDDGLDVLEDVIDHDHYVYMGSIQNRWHLPVYHSARNETTPRSLCATGRWTAFINLEIHLAGYNSLYWSESKSADITCPIPGGGGGGCVVICGDGSGAPEAMGVNDAVAEPVRRLV
jgi:hypothetical protein